MSCSGYKYNDTCKPTMATCVEVEQTFPSISSLSGQTCSDLDTVLEDIYDLIENNTVDMTQYDKGCLDYSPLSDSQIKPINVLNKLTEELCTLKTTVAGIDSVDISDLDYSCLGTTDPCGNPVSISNLKDLLQLLIDKHCDCCNSN